MRPILLLASRSLTTVLFTFAVALGARAAPDVHGTVIDETTQAPLAGAHVVVAWIYQSGAWDHTFENCAGVGAAVTAADGSYWIKGPFRDGHPQVRVHLAGYQQASVTDGSAVMRRATADHNERMRELLRLTKLPTACREEESTDGVKAFGEAAAREAHALATTPWESAVAEILDMRAREPLAWLHHLPEEQAIMAKYARSAADDTEQRDGNDMTPLMRAVEEGKLADIRALLARGADPNRASRNGTALDLALKRYFNSKVDKRADKAHRWEVITTLLAAPGIDVDRVESDRYPTTLARVLDDDNGDMEIADALLKAGADPNRVSGDKSPLRAAMRKRTRKLDVYAGEATRELRLVARWPRTDLNAAMGPLGFRPLHDAVNWQSDAVLRELLEAGADPNAPDARGQSPIVMAARLAAGTQQEKPKMVLQLLAESPKSSSGELRIAAQIASAQGRDDIARIVSARSAAKN